MAKKKYEELSDQIIDLVGGKGNVSYLAHCITRLRFTVKDKSKVKDKEIEKLPGAVGINWSGDQLQVIIGQNVGDVYKMICEKHDFEMKGSINENLEDKKKGFNLNTIFDSISGCVTPLLPLLIGGGMIKAVLLILLQLNLMTPENPTYIVLSFAGDAAFHFLPVFIGATGARKFGANMAYGMLIGATLIHPQFIEMITSGTPLSIYSIPVYATTYGSTIFPMILATFILSYVERFITKYTPKIVKSMVVPLLTLLIMLPLTLCLLAPLGSILGTYITDFIMWLYDTTGFFAVGIVCVLYLPLCLTGMHTATLPVLFTMLTTVGYDPLLVIASMLYTINQGVVALLSSVKTKDTEERSEALTCTFTSFVAGISEPALFGFTLKNKRLIYASMIGCFAGGLYAGITNVYCYAIAGTVGFLGLPGFVGPDSMNLINMIIAIIISGIVTFGLGFKFGYKKEEVTE